jgi:UDP-N-acetylmuramate dehydrogenase
MDAAILENYLKATTSQGPETGWQEHLKKIVQGEVRFNEPLRKYTSIQIGGPADALIFPAHIEDLKNIVQFAQEKRVPWMILGLGSNVLVKEGGVQGIVFRLHKTLQQFKKIDETESEVLLQAEAGVPLPKLVEMCRQQGWSGMEGLYGIPGTIGGTLVMNAGTREVEMKDPLVEIQVLRPDGTMHTYPKNKLKYEYRSLGIPSKEIILSGKFRLKKSDPAQVQAKTLTCQKRRQETQPLDYPNIGSVFKNPQKGFAAQMIEELGLKGVRVGGARISTKHANFIINENGATARDVLILIGLIKDKVKETLQVRLELEVKLVGEDEPL